MLMMVLRRQGMVGSVDYFFSTALAPVYARPSSSGTGFEYFIEFIVLA
jgi:hypothetical protein